MHHNVWYYTISKEIEKIKQQNINQIEQLKQQHQYELVEIRREINEKPKVTKISSEEQLTADSSQQPKRKRRQPITFDDPPRESNEIESLGNKAS